MTPFGARLRELRSNRGMTQSSLAERLNVSPAYLSALEHGRRGRPGPGLVMEICGHFDLIWDEAEELKRLAEHSKPKVTLNTGGLSPRATELVNLLDRGLPDLSDLDLGRLIAILKGLETNP